MNSSSSSSSSSALQLIIKRAKEIRGGDRSTGSWRRAVEQASREYQARVHPSCPRRPPRPSVASCLKGDEALRKLYTHYRQELQQLKQKYWNAGLQIKSTEPRKYSPTFQSSYQRKRLPPVLL